MPMMLTAALPTARAVIVLELTVKVLPFPPVGPTVNELVPPVTLALIAPLLTWVLFNAAVALPLLSAAKVMVLLAEFPKALAAIWLPVTLAEEPVTEAGLPAVEVSVTE
jgi:hypothetical protein